MITSADKADIKDSIKKEGLLTFLWRHRMLKLWPWPTSGLPTCSSRPMSGPIHQWQMAGRTTTWPSDGRRRHLRASSSRRVYAHTDSNRRQGARAACRRWLWVTGARSGGRHGQRAAGGTSGANWLLSALADWPEEQLATTDLITGPSCSMIEIYTEPASSLCG